MTNTNTCDQCGVKTGTATYTKSVNNTLELCSSCTPKANESEWIGLLAWPPTAMLEESLAAQV